MQAKLIKLKVPDDTVIKWIVQRSNTQNIDNHFFLKKKSSCGWFCVWFPPQLFDMVLSFWSSSLPADYKAIVSIMI